MYSVVFVVCYHRRRHRHHHLPHPRQAIIASLSLLISSTPFEYGRPPAELHPDAATDPRPPAARRHILVPAVVRPGRSIRQGSRQRCSDGWG